MPHGGIPALGLGLPICVVRSWAQRCSSIVWSLDFILPPGGPRGWHPGDMVSSQVDTEWASGTPWERRAEGPWSACVLC